MLAPLKRGREQATGSRVEPMGRWGGGKPAQTHEEIRGGSDGRVSE